MAFTRRSWPRPLSSPLLLVLACGPDGDTSTSDSATNTGDGATTGDALCSAPEDVVARFAVAPWERSIDSDCTVDAVTVDAPASAVEYALTCGADALTLTVEMNSFIGPAPVVQQVHLDYIVTPGFTTSQWFALRSISGSGALILGGVMAETLDPPSGSLSDLFQEISIELTDMRCAPEPGECGQHERVAIELSYANDVVTLFDQRAVDVGLIYGFGDGYELLLEAARDHDDDALCLDYPQAWFQLVTTQLRSD